MKRKVLLFLWLLIAGAAVWFFAESLQPAPKENRVTLIKKGWDSDIRFGEIAFLTFRATELTEGAWDDFVPFARNLCNQFASQVIRNVKEETVKSNPASIKVTVLNVSRKPSSIKGTYFAVTNGTCGRDLLD